jgi:hypothetical protein
MVDLRLTLPDLSGLDAALYKLDSEVIDIVLSAQRAFPEEELRKARVAQKVGMSPSTIYTLNNAFQPIQLDIPVSTIVDLENTLNSVLQQIDSPSIQADLATIQITQRKASTSTPSTTSPVNPSHEIPPEERILNKTSWEGRDWYQDRIWEIAVTIVDHIFLKAKQAGELTDATEDEIAVGMTAVAFVIAFFLTSRMVAPITAAGAAGGITKVGIGASEGRVERKGLGEGDDE